MNKELKSFLEKLINELEKLSIKVDIIEERLKLLESAKTKSKKKE